MSITPTSFTSSAEKLMFPTPYWQNVNALEALLCTAKSPWPTHISVNSVQTLQTASHRSVRPKRTKRDDNRGAQQGAQSSTKNVKQIMPDFFFPRMSRLPIEIAANCRDALNLNKTGTPINRRYFNSILCWTKCIRRCIFHRPQIFAQVHQQIF